MDLNHGEYTHAIIRAWTSSMLYDSNNMEDENAPYSHRASMSSLNLFEKIIGYLCKEGTPD